MLEAAHGDDFCFSVRRQPGQQARKFGGVDRDTGRTVRLFVADGTQEGSEAKVQLYLGEFEVSADRPTLPDEAPDQDGVQRKVLIFRLRPVGTVLRRDQDVSAIGDAPTTPQVETVAVDSAALPAGSAEAVPIEAFRAHEYPVAGSTAATAVKREAELVTRYQKHLEKRGATCMRYKLRPPGELRDLFTDLFDETANVLYEAKGVATREAVRMAIGQLLDYSRHIPATPGLAVLLPTLPTADLLDLLSRHNIRCVYEDRTGVFADA